MSQKLSFFHKRKKIKEVKPIRFENSGYYTGSYKREAPKKLKADQNKQGDPSPSCSLIFPCHNEEKSIALIINKALKVKERIERENPPIPLEIIVVNDGSTDNSQNILDTYKDKIKIFHLKKQRGYGAALKEGFLNAKGNFLSFCDLDSTCEPQELNLLFKTALTKNTPVVWGNRIHSKSAMPFIRRAGNRIFSLVLYLLSCRYIKDPCSGFRVFKKKRLKKNLFLFPDNLSFSLALTAYCIREKVPFKELTISYNQRQGKSKLNSFKDGFLFLKTIADALIFKKY